MNNLPPEPPPLDFDDVPDDPFPNDLFAALPEPEEYAYDPSLDVDPFDMEAWFAEPTIADLDNSNASTFMPPAPNDESWGWYEAQLIGVERETDEGTQYEIGCIDVYADLNTGDLGASYLPIADFSDLDAAAGFYHQLQGELHDNATPVGEIPKFAEATAQRFNPDVAWRGASEVEYGAYEAMRDLNTGDVEYPDDPPEHAIDDLVQTATTLSAVDVEPLAPTVEDHAAFKALSEIGIDAAGFDPAKDPPPFYDAETGTAYWIGVFQPDQDDHENCITSILSLGRNAETGEMEAQLAPCVPGDWDKTYTAAEHLIGIAQRGGIEPCFDAAEGMALATEQRELWETPLGLPLERDAAQDIADYTRNEWEIDL